MQKVEQEFAFTSRKLPQVIMVSRAYLFTGYARLPAGIAAGELYRVVSLGVKVDAEGRILAADCTLATQLSREFFAGLLVGNNLVTEMDKIVKLIEEHYHGDAQRALIAALRVAGEKCLAYFNQI
jgi:hypothetical protein